MQIQNTSHRHTLQPVQKKSALDERQSPDAKQAETINMFYPKAEVTPSTAQYINRRLTLQARHRSGHIRPRRKIATFASTSQTAELPADLGPEYQRLALAVDKSRIDQLDFIQHNKLDVANVGTVRVASAAARMAHQYRTGQLEARGSLRNQPMVIQENPANYRTEEEWNGQSQRPEPLAKNLEMRALRQCECHIEN